MSPDSSISWSFFAYAILVALGRWDKESRQITHFWELARFVLAVQTHDVLLRVPDERAVGNDRIVGRLARVEEYSDSLLATPDLKDAVPSLLGPIQPTHLGGLEKPCVRSNQDRALEDV